MKVRALRGVCIGVGQHLKAGDSADLDAAMVTFLTGIGAVELAPIDPAPQTIHTEPAAPASPEESAQLPIDPDAKPSVGKSGKKEK